MLTSQNLFAQSALKLEGDFKFGPAIILIILLITFIMVGVLNRAKNTSDYWAAGRKIGACFFEWNTLIHHVYNVDSIE